MLYRKYRSQTFGEIVGQGVVTKTLRNAVSTNRVAHAYIFSGPRGTGKTSTARILAKAINCRQSKDGEPCNDCDACKQITEGRAVDVIEIDAASHTSVDDVRDLIEKVNFSPVNLDKKVYIIDEVHMLSRSAFNALLKTLEEPPSHVLFILATTEIHKIPVTVLSRCQRFDFKLGGEEEIREVLKGIVDGEGVEICDTALKYVVDIAQGSYRDAISTMERILSREEISSDKEISAAEVRGFLGIPDDEKFELLFEFLVSGKTQEALDLINAVVESGHDLQFFSSYFLKFLRLHLIESLEGDQNLSAHFYKILKVFSEADKRLSNSPILQLPLEMAVIKITTNLSEVTAKEDLKLVKAVEEKRKRTSKRRDNISKNEKVEKVARMADKKDDKKKKQVEEQAGASDGGCSIKVVREGWQNFIASAKPFNGHLYAFISKSEVSGFDDAGRLVLTVPYDFYKERIEDTKSQEILAKVSAETFGVSLQIKCVVGEVDVAEVEVTGDTEDAEVVDEALDVFGEDVV